MITLPDLDRLSVAGKDELIRTLFAQVQFLTGQVTQLSVQVTSLSAKVVELEGRLALNSRNSSKPPSTDGLNKPKPKSLRQAGQKPTGGQQGHDGHTLKQVAQPNHIETHRPPASCDACHRPLDGGTVVEKRQVFDIPPLRYEVTEHQLMEVHCACGKVCRGVFPEAVSAHVQYGPHIKAVAVHLTHHHMMPLARTGSLIGDLFGLPISDAAVLAASEEAKDLLSPTVEAIADALKIAPVAHADCYVPS
jgi:transposase